jgi:hypothetical protein
MQFLAGPGIPKVTVWGVAHLYLCLDKMWQVSLEAFHRTPYKVVVMVIA